MIAQIFYGHNRVCSVTFFTLQLFLNGAVTAGYLGNGLDIAPNFSGTIFGLANTVSSIGGYVSTFMVGELTSKEVNASSFRVRETSGSDIDSGAFAANVRPMANCVRHSGGHLHLGLACFLAVRPWRGAAMEQSTRTYSNATGSRRSRSAEEEQPYRDVSGWMDGRNEISR